jgi:hypothetical protein
MDNNTILEALHPLEIKLLLGLPQEEPVTADTLVLKLGYNVGQANQALSWLAQKELVRESARRTVVSYALTDLGREYQTKGLPEERLLALVKQEGPLLLPEIAQKLGLENKDIGSAFGVLSKELAAGLNEEKKVVIKDETRALSVASTRALLEALAGVESAAEDELPADVRGRAAELGAKRGSTRSPVKILEREIVTFTFAPAAIDIRAVSKSAASPATRSAPSPRSSSRAAPGKSAASVPSICPLRPRASSPAARTPTSNSSTSSRTSSSLWASRSSTARSSRPISGTATRSSCPNRTRPATSTTCTT